MQKKTKKNSPIWKNSTAELVISNCLWRWGEKRMNMLLLPNNTLPSHWPVFWFLLKPALHWHIALTFVWLQTASSPHGFVFFPHTSPLETTNKRQDFDYTSVLWILDTCCVFLLMCKRREGIIPFHTAHNTTQTWAYIHYHKQQNVASKMRRLLSFLITSSWHSVLFISSERLFDLFGRVNCHCTYGPCSLARPSRHHRSRWRGRTAAGSGCSAGCRTWTLSSHKVEVFRLPPLLQDTQFQWKKGKKNWSHCSNRKRFMIKYAAWNFKRYHTIFITFTYASLLFEDKCNGRAN